MKNEPDFKKEKENRQLDKTPWLCRRALSLESFKMQILHSPTTILRVVHRLRSVVSCVGPGLCPRRCVFLALHECLRQYRQVPRPPQYICRIPGQMRVPPRIRRVCIGRIRQHFSILGRPVAAINLPMYMNRRTWYSTLKKREVDTWCLFFGSSTNKR